MSLLQANVIELSAVAQSTSTRTATGVDIRNYDGPINITLASSAATAGTNPTLDVKIQHSDASGSGYADVSGATFTQVTDASDLTEMLTLQCSDLKRYVRVVGTIGGTSTPTFQFGVVAHARKKAGRNASQSV